MTPIIIIAYLLIISLITFIAFAIDKKKARRGEWRIPESTLMWLAAFGGSIAALVAMQVLRHKTQHKKFYLGIPAILFVQVGLIAVYFIYCG